MTNNAVRPDSSSPFRAAGTQFAKFLAVGGAGTALHYLVLVLLVSLLHAAPGPAAATGAAAGGCVVYLLNRRFTFGSERRHLDTLPRFAMLAVSGALLNGVLVGMLSAAGLYFLLAQVIATGIILVINFVVSKMWVFR